MQVELLYFFKDPNIFPVYTFQIKNIPRFVLMELTRHRECSYSVKSTRYCLKELANEKPFIEEDVENLGGFIYDYTRAFKYIAPSRNPKMHYQQLWQLEELRNAVQSKEYTSDEAKYLVPESYLTNLVWTINVRSLRNFLHLRLSKSAHFKIRELAELVYNVIPQEHKFLFEDLRKEEND